MRGHGNIRPCLHRLKIIDSPDCPCKQDIQTVGHLIFQCECLKYELGILKNSVLKAGNWPISKRTHTIVKSRRKLEIYNTPIINHRQYPCKQDLQTTDHLTFQCEKLKNELGMLKNSVLNAGNWPISKSELVNKNLKQFIH